MHLFALCYEQDLKKYGFDHVLEKFVAEMKLLQKVGFEIVLPVAGKCTIYASICQVTCDNLAVNSMLGFIESFACDFFCTVCYATQDTIQHCFGAEHFCRRTISEYNKGVSNIAEAARHGKNHSRGVKSVSVLNRILMDIM